MPSVHIRWIWFKKISQWNSYRPFVDNFFQHVIPWTTKLHFCIKPDLFKFNMKFWGGSANGFLTCSCWIIKVKGLCLPASCCSCGWYSCSIRATRADAWKTCHCVHFYQRGQRYRNQRLRNRWGFWREMANAAVASARPFNMTIKTQILCLQGCRISWIMIMTFWVKFGWIFL